MLRLLIALAPLILSPSPPGEKVFLQALREGVFLQAREEGPSPEEAFREARRLALVPGAPSGWIVLVKRYVRLAGEKGPCLGAAWKEYDLLVRSLGGKEGGGKADLSARAERVVARAERLEDPVLRAEAANLAGVLCTDTFRFDRARAFYFRALEAARTWDLALLEAAVLVNLARQALFLADYRKALEYLDRLPGRPAGEDPYLGALAEHHRAAALAGLGRTGECLEALERSRELFRRAGRLENAFDAAAERIRLLFQAGRRRSAVAEAEKLLSSPLARKEMGTRVAAASLLVSLLGSTGGAWEERLAELARRAGEAGKLEYKFGFLLSLLQAARRRKDLSRASRILLDVEETARRIGGVWALRRAELARARLLKKTGDLEAAKRIFEGLARPGKKGVPVSIRSPALAGLGSLALREGKPERAARFYLEAAGLEGGGKDPFRRANLLAKAAGCFFAAGKGREGMKFALEALEMLPRARRSKGRWDLGLRVLGRKAPVFDDLIEGILEGKAGDSRRSFAFSLAERLKAGGLYDRILALERRKSSGPRPFHLLAALEEGIRIRKEAGSPREAVLALERRRAELLRVYSLPEPGGEGPPEPVGLEELRQALPPSMVVLFFHTGRRVSALWAVRREGIRFRLLPGRRELLARLDGFRRAVSSLPGYGSWRVLRREGRRAAELLLGGSAAFLRGGDTAVVIPGPGLEDFPFSALVRPSGKGPSGPEGIRYLGPDEGVSFLFLPSASLLVHFLRSPPMGNGGGAILVEADHPSPLPWLRAELKSVEKALEGRKVFLLKGRDALRVLGTVGRKAGILHLGGHAWIGEDGKSPFLRIAGEEISPARILAWGLGPKLVNLAACRTALGRSLPLEGRAGFARAFLACGSRRILVSAWEVQDEGAARFNSVFYRNLGRGAGRALLEARRALRRDPVFRSPFFWASFQLIGAP